MLEKEKLKNKSKGMNNLIEINKKLNKKIKSLDKEESAIGMKFYLPGFGLKKEELPEIKKWEVGKTYEMKVKVKMTSYSENKYLEDREDRTRAEFEIIGVEAKDNNKLFEKNKD